MERAQIVARAAVADTHPNVLNDDVDTLLGEYPRLLALSLGRRTQTASKEWDQGP